MSVTGEARVTGEEVTVPSLRQVAVARAYIQGLESDRERLQQIQQSLIDSGWEVVRLASFTKALVRVIRELRDDGAPADEEFEDRVRYLLDEADRLVEEAYLCPCGHSKYDHDEKGCMYLQCRGVCK
jgi:hypothetical protein